MTPIPSQRQRCDVFDWCTASGRRHEQHVGEVRILVTETGRRLRVSLTAEGDAPPRLAVELSFRDDQPLLEVVELEPAEAVELAGMLLRLARTAHTARHPQDHNH